MINALSPIEVTEFGMVILVKLQRANAWVPIDVTESGIETLDKLLQLKNALNPIEVTLYVVLVLESVAVSGMFISPEYIGEFETTSTVVSEVILYIIPLSSNCCAIVKFKLKIASNKSSCFFKIIYFID